MIFYAIVGGVGLLFLIVTWLVGEIGDFFGGIFDHDVHVGAHDVGFGNGGEIRVGPPLVDVRSVAAFVTGFGAVGYLLTYLGWNPYWAVLPAMGTGVVMSLASYGITVLLFRQQATSSYSPNDLIGQSAEVTTPIPTDGMGEVSLTFKGAYSHYAARSSDNQPLASGTRVQIVEFLGTTAVVSKKIA